MLSRQYSSVWLKLSELKRSSCNTLITLQVKKWNYIPPPQNEFDYSNNIPYLIISLYLYIMWVFFMKISERRRTDHVGFGHCPVGCSDKHDLNKE